jgi:ferritin-like metal-binding protein YciE
MQIIPDTMMTKTKKTTSTGDPPAAVPQSFLNQLGEMHTAERELTVALPLMAKAAKSKDFKMVLQIHFKQTKGHVKALDAVAKSLAIELPMKGCKRITQLVAEGVTVIGKRLVTPDQDQALIAVGQKVEQFEIEQYRKLCATAKAQGYTHEFALLTSILNQEEMASELLAALAAGKGPIDKLIEKASLKRAGARK